MLDKTLIYQMTGGKDEGMLQEFIKEICWAVQLFFEQDAEDKAASHLNLYADQWNIKQK